MPTLRARLPIPITVANDGFDGDDVGLQEADRVVAELPDAATRAPRRAATSAVVAVDVAAHGGRGIDPLRGRHAGIAQHVADKAEIPAEGCQADRADVGTLTGVDRTGIGIPRKIATDTRKVVPEHLVGIGPAVSVVAIEIAGPVALEQDMVRTAE